VTLNNALLVLLVFGFFLLINVISSGGHFDITDGVEYFLSTESMVLKHSAKVYPDSPSITAGNILSFNVNKSIAGYWYLAHQTPLPLNKIIPIYEAHCCLLSAIAVPFYYASIIFSVPPILVVGLLVNSLILTLTSVVIFCFSLELYKSKRVAFALSLIFGVCSFAWPYNTTLHPQPLSALLLIASAYFIYISQRERKLENNYQINKGRIYFAGLGGLFLAFSIYSHPPNILVIPGVLIYAIYLMKHYKQNLGIFLISFSIIILLAGGINYWRFGSFTNFGYGTQVENFSTNNGWEGLVGLIVSPGAGLIFFFPIVILFPIAFKYIYKQNKPLFFLAIYVMIVSFLYFGTFGYTAQWEGQSWGPRYLMAALPFATIVFGTLLQRLNGRLFLKLAIILLCVAGFYVNLLGKLVWDYFGARYGWTVERLNNYDSSVKPPVFTSVDIMTWMPTHSIISLDMKVLTSNFVTNETLNTIEGWGTNTLINCPYDLYVYCKIGVGPIMLILTVSAVLATVIIMDRPRLLFRYFKNTMSRNETINKI
jgi:hypothetical protein